MSLNGNLRINTSITNSKDDVDLSTPSEAVSTNISKTLSTGVLWHDTVSLSANQIYTIDVGDDSLSDSFGNTLALSGVTSMYLKAGTSNGGDFTVSGITNSILNTLPALGAGEGFGLLADVDVTTNSKICIVNGVTSGTADIIVTGNE